MSSIPKEKRRKGAKPSEIRCRSTTRGRLSQLLRRPRLALGSAQGSKKGDRMTVHGWHCVCHKASRRKVASSRSFAAFSTSPSSS